jgi:hypothetical protein
MATKTIEIMIGKKPDHFDRAKIGNALATRLVEPEVEGRDAYWRWAEFPCGHICRIWWYTNAFHAYVCPICGTPMEM